MFFDIITLYPEMISGYFNAGHMKRAVRDGLMDYRVRSFRSHGIGKHRSVDDYPFGGDPGMLIRFDVIDSFLSKTGWRGKIICPSPRGKKLDHALAKKLAKEKELCFICGHFEGMDQRFFEHYEVEEVSLGDFVLNGGELAALVTIDAVARLSPGYIGNQDGLRMESFEDILLESDQYTRPREHEGRSVPESLTSGHKKKIQEWKEANSLFRTWERREDLFEKLDLERNQVTGLIKQIEVRQKVRQVEKGK